jgi:hypothetical protein
MTALLLALAWATQANAEPFRYPTGKHGNGELRYIDGVPVLLVRGTPEEMGEQIGVLALKPARQILNLKDEFLKGQGWQWLFPVLVKAGNLMRHQFPPHHLKELDAAAKASGWPLDILVFGNAIPDLQKLARCSALIVELGRSDTGGCLFGRNLDWFSGRIPLHEYVLVTIYRPTGKHAFVSIGFPGMIGIVSGMNDAGLALAELTVNRASDRSSSVDMKGVPFTLTLRRVLEDCSTIAEAEKLLRSTKRVAMHNFAVCDLHHGAVFEVTTKQLCVRPAQDALCCCTNHFRSKELALPADMNCRRYDTLEKSRELNRLGLTDVARKLDDVNQGKATFQTMIFEPSPLKLHVAFGPGPATRLPLHVLHLREVFR